MAIINIGIVGDYNPGSKTQPAINNSLDWLKRKYDFQYQWVDTTLVEKEKENILKQYSGIWSASGSPFKSLNGAVEAIRYARVNNIPHLGTCGGFQHTIIEFARNVIGIKEAQHEEYNNNSSNLLITKLSCSLAGKSELVKIKDKTLASICYGKEGSMEDFHCSFGINPLFKDKLKHSEILISGIDENGEIRIIEIPKNDFFIATLFVPQTKSTLNQPHPLIKTFVESCIVKNV